MTGFVNRYIGRANVSGTGKDVKNTNTSLITPTIREKTSVVSSNTNAIASTNYVIIADMTLTLPSSPVSGDWVGFVNRSGVTTPIIDRNGSVIMGLSENMILDTINARGKLIYADGTRGWVLE